MQDFTYSDISIMFKKHPSTKDVIVKYDVDSVKQALTTLFLTNKFEKRFDPQFGIGIHGMLFENMTPLNKAALLKTIQNQVKYYEPRVVIENIKVNDNYDGNNLIVDFYFWVIDNPHVKEILSLSFERIR